MADDIIDIEDYEVKDTQIVETSDEDDYQDNYSQREYDGHSSYSGYYKSFSLNSTSILIIVMVVILLIAIFIMTFD